MPTEKMLKTVRFIEVFTGKICKDYTFAGVMNFIEKYQLQATISREDSDQRRTRYVVF